MSEGWSTVLGVTTMIAYIIAWFWCGVGMTFWGNERRARLIYAAIWVVLTALAMAAIAASIDSQPATKPACITEEPQ